MLRAGRRLGKTKCGQMLSVLWSLNWREMIARKGWEFKGTWEKGHEPVNLITMPTAVMARQIWFEPLYSMLHDHPLVEDINKQSMSFRFKGDRPDLLIRGANDANGDRLRGLKILALLCDEVQNFRQPVIDRVLLPAMSDIPFSQGYMFFTPLGKHNVAYRLWKRGDISPERQLNLHFHTADNPYFPKDELEEYRRILPPGVFREEYEATWEDIPGAFFTSLDESCFIDALPLDWDEVILGVDHGELNPAHVVFVRSKNVYIYVDGWQPNCTTSADGEGEVFQPQPIPTGEQDANLIDLAGKWGVNLTRCDPARPSRILDIRALGKEYNKKGLYKCVSGFNRQHEGRAQLHKLMASERFKIYRGQTPGGNTLDGQTYYDLLKSYHRKIGEDGLPIDDEAPGQNSHSIDATRYALCQSGGFS